MEISDEIRTKARRIAEHLLGLGETPQADRDAQRSAVAAAPALDYRGLQQRVRELDGLLTLYRAAARAAAAHAVVVAPDEPRTDDPRDDDLRSKPPGDVHPRDDAAPDEGDRALDFIRKAHRLLLEHPVAAKQAYAALAREGRAYAVTVEGAALRDRLLQSRRLRRASLLWRSLTMGMLDEDDHGELPSGYLDHLLSAVDRSDLERLLGQLHLERSPP
jgi:hypothetical protein